MQQVISDESIAINPASPALKALITMLAVMMSLYHMYVAGFGPPEAVIFRGTHLIFALGLVFLLYPSRASGGVAARSYFYRLRKLYEPYYLYRRINET